MKLAWVGLAGVLALAGCKQQQNPQAASENLAKERQEANQELTELRQDAAKERSEISQNVQEKEAQVRQDLAQEQREVREAEYQGEGTGGSGALAANGTLEGVVQSASNDSITIKDRAGKAHDLKANANTTVTMDGKAVKLENLKEGAEVRASYATENGNKVVNDVTITPLKEENKAQNKMD